MLHVQKSKTSAAGWEFPHISANWASPKPTSPHLPTRPLLMSAHPETRAPSHAKTLWHSTARFSETDTIPNTHTSRQGTRKMALNIYNIMAVPYAPDGKVREGTYLPHVEVRRKGEKAHFHVFFLTHETFKSTFLRCFYDFAHKKSVKIFF